MNEIRIDIPRQFSPTPGARFRSDGRWSGEEFREDLLEPFFADANDNRKIVVHLDGAAGYATSFLEEAFGGLARKHGSAKCLARLVFISVEDPLLVDEICGYITDVGKR